MMCGYVQFEKDVDQHPDATGDKTLFQHLEADGTAALNAYIADADAPSAKGAETAIREWIADMVRQDVLEDVPYIVTAEEDDGDLIVMVSDNDIPFILYASLT